MEAKEIDIPWKIMDFFMLRFFIFIFRCRASKPQTSLKNQCGKGFQPIAKAVFFTAFFLR